MQAHRGSSPQIRAFGPDGRTTAANEGSLFHFTRASSPLRAISLDARCPSPASTDTSEPSPSSLAALASSTTCTSTMCISPKLGRCLSPLLLPPKTNSVDPNCGPASPLGAIQPDLYQRPDGPIFITAPDGNLALGKLHFQIKYDSQLFDLAVHLIEGTILHRGHHHIFTPDIESNEFPFFFSAHNLCAIDDGGFRDPFVRLQLSPDVDNRKRESNIHRGEFHPYFDQHFKFPISRDQLPGKELILQVLDCDRYSQNDVMGEVRIKIDDLDLSKSVEVKLMTI